MGKSNPFGRTVVEETDTIWYTRIFMYKIAFDTLGCRLNQAETATLHDRFAAQGYTVTTDTAEADVYVINTCTLTSQATSKCRRRIRSVVRRNPDACVAVIGCYAQTDAEALAAIPGVDYIVGTADKLALAEIIKSPVKLPAPQIVRNRVHAQSFTIDGAGRYPHNTRANIKVQEGCDFVCAFCIIPRSRGRARSREFTDIIREARVLADAGHRELVVTGVNMGTYRDGRYTLADVIDALCDIPGLDRVRLSSIEPTTIEDRIISEMARGDKLCPYLHVPMQSGDTQVLSSMRRRYDAQTYRDFMQMVVNRVPNIGLGTDVMVGFPGETEVAFENSCRLIADLPYTHLHVFSFSARERTSAFTMPGKTPPETIHARSARVHRLGEMKKMAFYDAQTGRRVRVLFEERRSNGSWVGFADNYVRVSAAAHDELSNQLVDVDISGVQGPEDDGAIFAKGDIAALEPTRATL